MTTFSLDPAEADDLINVDLDERELIDWERLDFSFAMDQHSNPPSGYGSRNTHRPDDARRGHVAGPMGGPSEVGILSSLSQSHANDSPARFIQTACSFA
jgi:hypothetical protein